jgi:predicted permease
MLSNLGQDVRLGFRGLLKDRGFALAAVVSIALGVGANSAIFSLIDQALLRRLPVKDADRLVLLNWRGDFVGSGWGSGNLMSYPFFRELKADNDVFEGLIARHPTTVHLAVEDAPEPVRAEVVSGSYFSVLGVQPALGRLLEDPDDRQPEAHPVVVLSFDYWKNRLGGRPDIVGRTVRINSHPMTVVGVAAAGFRGLDWGETPSVWVPTMMKRQATPDFDWLEDRRARWVHVFGRLKPGVTLAQARAALQPWFKAMLHADTRHESWPVVSEEQKRGFLASTLELLPASQGRSDLRGQLERPLFVLLAATGLVLLLACLNVANLCVARAFARRHETALRLALGASRRRIASESLTQTAILSIVGGALGVLVAPAVIGGLISFLPPDVDLVAAVNTRVLGLSLGIALATGLVFGLAPALQASREEPGFTLKEGSARVAGGLGLRKALVVTQVALAVVLLIGAGLFVRTLVNLRAQGPGFQTANLLSFRLEPRRSGYTAAEAVRRIRDVLAAVRNRPEVQGAGVSSVGLLQGGSWNAPLTIESGGRTVTDGVVHCNAVSPGFFEALGATIVTGRDFDERDSRSDEQAGGVPADGRGLDYRSAIVNASFAKRYFGDRSPIGARLGIGNRPNTPAELEIVGVVGNFSYRGIRQDDVQAYFPLFEGPQAGGAFYVRTRMPSTAALSAVRTAVRQVDPQLTIADLRTLDDQLDRLLSNERLLATLATAFAGLAVLLAVVGLYGVTSFVVSRRTREIGIRLALGSSRGAALWLVLRDTAVMVSVGLAMALPVVWALGRLVQSQLFGLSALDGATIAAAVFLIVLVALGASALPARRAASVSPTEALRYE